MERQYKNEIFKLVGGLALISSLGTSLYYLYSYLTRKQFPSWLEKEVSNAREKLKLDNRELNSDEFKTLLVILLMEIQDIIFYDNYSLFEENRQNFLENEQKYAEAVKETLDYREKCFSEALVILSKKLGLENSYLRLILGDFKEKESFTDLYQKVRLEYPEEELPRIDKESFKNAYVEYLKHMTDLTENNIRHDCIANVQPELEEIVKWLYYQNKLILYDTIYKKYRIKEKYFPQLAKKFNLSEDSDISSLLINLKKLINEKRNK